MIETLASLLVLYLVVAPAAGQQIPPTCTAAMINSFSPCLTYLAGGGSGSPTADCCKAFGGLVGSSSDCACLIVTGGIPFNTPFNRALAVSLPAVCGSTSVPLFQCNINGTAASGGSTPSTPAPIALPTVPTGPNLMSPPPVDVSPPPPPPPPPTAAEAPTLGKLFPSAALKLQEKFGFSFVLLVAAKFLMNIF